MKAFAEAEAHKGVSLIVAYAPCVMQVSTASRLCPLQLLYTILANMTISTRW